MRKVSNSFGIGKRTVSKIVRKVTGIISKQLGSKYIKLPKAEEEVKDHAGKFYQKYGFPQCIGAVDGTHIQIKRPKEISTYFINRKSNFIS